MYPYIDLDSIKLHMSKAFNGLNALYSDEKVTQTVDDFLATCKLVSLDEAAELRAWVNA